MNITSLPEPNIISDQNTPDQNIVDQNTTDSNARNYSFRTPKPKKLNQDYCNTCGNGGQLMCCDSCPRAFHFTCLVPPLDIDNTPQGNWYCRVCCAEENPPSGPQGLFQELIEKACSSNPKSFSLPESLRNTFEGVGTGQCEEYVDTLKMKKFWHFDCLDPPMVIRPPISKRWMCPAHADHILPPTRKFKSDKNLPFSDNTIVQLPRKNLVECDPEFFLNDRKHRVPKQGVKLNYISQIVNNY
ncbi:6577_t:CDS:2 [Entrophospora sp. SA101]|nr:6577_t:CDS:2 [Entrophospora sp. SA101]